ncbi:hypothetical protein [Pseudogulbenkiania subflava]|uniref:hypothetical protein n=1 Tax=Pseudogulbenkiania subflava TaxID=451637 RepID=UPI0011799138|nr:hypothetical protein [Pseudogulbenkiania subflava]
MSLTLGLITPSTASGILRWLEAQGSLWRGNITQHAEVKKPPSLMRRLFIGASQSATAQKQHNQAFDIKIFFLSIAPIQHRSNRKPSGGACSLVHERGGAIGSVSCCFVSVHSGRFLTIDAVPVLHNESPSSHNTVN